MNKAKIIVTVNKGNDSKEELLDFVNKGVNVFRFDLSSVTYNYCLSIIELIKEINKKLSPKVAIMLDTKGPRVCTGKFSGGKAIFDKGDKIRVYASNIVGDKTKFSVDYKNLVDDVTFGSIIKLSNGAVELEVIDKADNEEALICRVLKGGEVENNSNINIPDCKLKLSFMNSKNKQDIEFASKVSADFLALSFISGVEDVLDVNDLLIETGNDHTAIVSKIENERALEELDDILNISEGLIIARNDLGAEIPIERIPGIQKRIINKCHLAGKFSIVSTEIFQEDLTIPTRAEVSDIANAILDGTDAVLLGVDPIYSENSISILESINKVIETAENEMEYMDFYDRTTRSEEQNVTGCILSSAVYMANKLKCRAIVTPSISNDIVKKISRFRPICPIIVFTNSEEEAKNLSLNFGVYAMLVGKNKTLDNMIDNAKEMLKQSLSVNIGDKIVIISGYPMQDLNITNLIEIEEI